MQGYRTGGLKLHVLNERTPATIDYNVMKALPYRHYRQETISSTDGDRISYSNIRHSQKLKDFERPGNAPNTYGDLTFPDIATCLSENGYGHPDPNIKNKLSCVESEVNTALSRTRTRYVKTTENQDRVEFYHSFRERLRGRQLDFTSNSFHYQIPTTGLVNPPPLNEIQSTQRRGGFVTNNIHCNSKPIQLPDSFSIHYIWVDGEEYTIDFPDQYWVSDIYQLLSYINGTFSQNGHYLIDNSSGLPVYLLTLVPNLFTNTIEVQSKTPANFSADHYSVPLSALTPIDISAPQSYTWDLESTLYPQWNFVDSSPYLYLLLGFAVANIPSYFPVDQTNTYTTNPTATLYVSSTKTPLLNIGFAKTITHKPNNAKYNQQGAVDNTQRLLQVRYDHLPYQHPYNSLDNSRYTRFDSRQIECCNIDNN